MATGLEMFVNQVQLQTLKKNKRSLQILEKPERKHLSAQRCIQNSLKHLRWIILQK